MTKITEPGIYPDLSAEDYHADPCPGPSLSASFIKTMLDRSPFHAWAKHPRLNPGYEDEHKTIFDIGHAAHSMMLNDNRDIVVIPFDAYRKTEAKEARDKAYAAGKIPLLEAQWQEIGDMARQGHVQIQNHNDIHGAFQSGQSEVTLVWQEGKIWCRCRIDWVPGWTKTHTSGHLPFLDYKTTTNASPHQWGQRQMYDLGSDVTAAWYRRGIAAVLDHHDADYRFVVQEREEPYALCVIAPTPAAVGMADRKIAYALDLFRRCQEAGKWPGYPSQTCYVDPPVWHEKRWLDFENLKEAEGDEALFQKMIDWMAPAKDPTQ